MAKLDRFMVETKQLNIETLLAEIEIEEGDAPLNGTCPYMDKCEVRRQRLPTYRRYQPCHWLAFALGGDSWQRCPIFRGNELTEKQHG